MLCHHHHRHPHSGVEAFDGPLIRLPGHGGGGGGSSTTTHTDHVEGHFDEDDDDDDDGEVVSGSERILSVNDYGAIGDGSYNYINSFFLVSFFQAFKDAWYAACSSTSQKAILKIPEKRKYMVRPTDFAGPCSTNVTLRILGSILAPQNPVIWRKQNPRRWLYFHGISHLALRGRGVGIVDAMGEKWWAKSCKIRKINVRNAKKYKYLKHTCISVSARCMQALTFHKCRHLKVRNMTLLNSPHSHIAFAGCFHVKASGLKLIAPASSPDTDGIHISGSDTVYVQNTEIATGDDCISIGPGSNKVRIRNVACGPGHGISIGALGKLNTWAKVSDVQVSGAVLTNTKNGVRIKTWQGGQGYVDDIWFSNITMKNVSNPIIIDQYYCDTLQPCKNQTGAVKVSKVSFMNITGTSATTHAMRFACSDTFPCHGIHLQDIRLTLDSGWNATSFCWKASGFTYGLVDPPSCLALEDDYPVIINNPHSSGSLLLQPQ
ncbi:hypothetical protein Taro_042213 [Colocasia esculenta]|uniref:endo-polygalacturonase n=1 Tax=Colocasia esculenta TaxID=4460 RepID=A0A843WVU9_COLES|nr:hypothetical protein [Colocasia esculenta]